MIFSIEKIELFIFPIPFHSPLSFGKQKISALNRLRVCLWLSSPGSSVNSVCGWGEVPLNYPWFWPNFPGEEHQSVLDRIITALAELWICLENIQHPLMTGYEILNTELPRLGRNISKQLGYKVPELAVQVLNSAFDIALYDAYGKILDKPVYSLFDRKTLPVPFEMFFSDSPNIARLIAGRPLDSFFNQPIPSKLIVWHMVGIADPVDRKDFLNQLKKDGIRYVKIKLTGLDPEWDLQRLIDVGRITRECGVEALSVDYNGPYSNCGWLLDFLDNLEAEDPEVYERLQYIEQPITPEEPGDPLEIQEVTKRKPLIVDEGASHWKRLYEYYEAGWSGVALKICKSQTSSVLMGALSRVLGKICTVMDLTNPSLSQISHVQLASHLSDGMQLESNSMQYCPLASGYEKEIHPGLFLRCNGYLNLSSIKGSGYGYRIEEINRPLPDPIIYLRKSRI